jgi:small subunit ribosomal protein S17
MTKTIVVRVSQLARHPKYARVTRRASAFKVHDETNSASIGDWVKIMETRPVSKEKRWRLVEILKRASSAPPLPDDELRQADEAVPRVAQEEVASPPPPPGRGQTQGEAPPERVGAKPKNPGQV